MPCGVSECFCGALVVLVSALCVLMRRETLVVLVSAFSVLMRRETVVVLVSALLCVDAKRYQKCGEGYLGRRSMGGEVRLPGNGGKERLRF